jgi:signal transduction histidine kinase
MRYAYEYPVGSPKVSGLVAIRHEFFDWVLGVGISDEDMFAPVQDLKNVLIWAALLTSMVVVVLTFWAARQMSIPVKKLTEGARMIAGGNLSERVSVATRDEIGELAQSFNEMAESLQERSQALLELNRELENKVVERTQELQESHGEVERAYEELKETQVQLIQSEKMASLGQLVAGIAHEIKNPLNFIYGNTDFLRRYVSNLKELLRIYEEEDPTRQREAVRELKDRVNFEFVLGDLATLIDNFEEGAERIHSIIGDLRAFSRLDSDDFRMVDVHEPIELALNLVRQEYRDRITIHREYGELPKIECHSGRLSQVFMNLMSNACQAIVGEGDIWIRTSAGSDQVGVEIEDSGSGIEANHLHKVFEPFFTTKPVGKGTGLGLSISYGIVQNHKGTISVESPPGKGTSFRIELPVKQ